MSKIRCPYCGNNNIGKGKLGNHAALMPVGKIFTTGSAIIADVCIECGTIIRMTVEKPEKFKQVD
ncbi:MAG: transcription initiation factor TFIIIB [Desulfotomaculaceae bacterium]|nr:transcription initiation factor TFIIIB [Desulfotomaculaceae bacterium]